MRDERPRILIVDDDVDICCNVQDILGDCGYPTDVAHDGEAALRLVHQHAYALALIDLKMPGMDGVTLYQHIKRLAAETVAILITGYTAEPVLQRALDAGTWQVLAKPVDFGRLLALVRQVEVEPLVIVVDDDSDFCESIWQLLRQAGFRVAVAHGRDEAVAKAQRADYGIALADLRLQDGDGLDVLAAVRARNPRARTVLITGYRGDLHSAGETCGGLVDAIRYKPIDPAQLLETLRSFCS
jgi:DNA-binding NtrC family response regulator